MAEAFVSVILQQLASITNQEVQLIAGVDEELQNLTSNFQVIQAVLEDAESRQVKENSVRDWLDKLKNASYDIDDLLDEWNTAFENKKVCSFIPSYSFSPCQVVLRHGFSQKIKDLNKALDAIAKEKKRFNFSLNKGSGGIERQITSSIVDLSEVHGRYDDKNRLIGLLLAESSQGPPLSIISIVGMGGIGKTTLAQLAFNDNKVNTYFDKKIWVWVSDPFDEIRIAKAILESIKGALPNLDELDNLLKEIRQYIKDKKILLVLDDVWIEDSRKWEQLKNSLQCASRGSRILVTTRKDITAKIVKTTDTMPLGNLLEEESWSLFSQVAFYRRTSEECENFKDIGRKIVRKCNGLPLAIKTLGSLLRLKTQTQQWQSILDSDLWKLEEIEKSLFCPILLSYYDLSSNLRKCFLYCAIFPKDHVIQKDTLIKLWMSQGYLALDKNKDIKLVGEEYFENLAMRSFFQDFEKSEYDGKIIRCNMHTVVHDLAQFLTENECFTIEDTSHGKPQIYHSYNNVRHLMVSMEAPNPSPIHNQKKLRTLLINNEDKLLCTESTINLSQLIEKLTCLRTLALSGCLTEKLPTGIKNLVHLRYLKLDGYAYIKELPEMVCGLYNLQTLDLTNCSRIIRLPHGIGKLVNLRHLLIDGTKSLEYMPKGLERLTGLKPLSKFVIAGTVHGNKAFTNLEFLKNWNYRHGYFVLTGLGNVRDVSAVKAADFKSKKSLFDLTLSFDYDYEVIEKKHD